MVIYFLDGNVHRSHYAIREKGTFFSVLGREPPLNRDFQINSVLASDKTKNKVGSSGVYFKILLHCSQEPAHHLE